MGGIWLIGVKTDRKTNMPIFPLDGILAQPGIEERISQACWTGIYPALTPAIKVIRLPFNPERVVVVVDVRESIEAPHAIENTTKVYIRNASTTEPIAFVEIGPGVAKGAFLAK
jgi:predicted HTH transcriptional regulator